MAPASFVVWPLLLAVVFTASGLGKWRDDDAATARGWADMGVPEQLNLGWLRRLHPWAEIVLAAALVVAPGPLAVVAASAAALLCMVYLVLIVRAALRPEPTGCACFGEKARTPITGRTVVRNAVLLAAALLAVVHSVSAGSPLSVLLDAPAATWWWLLAVAGAAVTAVLIEGAPGESPVATQAPSGPGADVGEPGDYVRTLTPFAHLVDSNGLAYSIVDLSAARAQLLFFVSPGCGSCKGVADRLPEWQERLPEVQLRLVVTLPLEELAESRPDWAPYAMQDPNGDAARMLRAAYTPTAVLLGTDGMLAGGPVAGSQEIADFVNDIAAELDAARAASVVVPG